MEGQTRQQAAEEPEQKSSWRKVAQNGITILLVGLLCYLLLKHILSGDVAQTVATIVEIIAVGITALLVKFGSFFWRAVRRIFRASADQSKVDIVLIYTNSDFRWANWIEWYAKQKEYNLAKWEWNGIRDFKGLMKEASRQAEVVVSLVSSNYLALFQNNTDWFHELKSRNNAQSRNALIYVDSRAKQMLNEHFKDIQINEIKFVGDREEKARATPFPRLTSTAWSAGSNTNRRYRHV